VGWGLSEFWCCACYELSCEMFICYVLKCVYCLAIWCVGEACSSRVWFVGSMSACRGLWLCGVSGIYASVCCEYCECLRHVGIRVCLYNYIISDCLWFCTSMQVYVFVWMCQGVPCNFFGFMNVVMPAVCV